MLRSIIQFTSWKGRSYYLIFKYGGTLENDDSSHWPEIHSLGQLVAEPIVL